MSRIVYSILCTIDYHSMEEEWLEWMREEHIPAVRAAGAASAEIIKIDPESDAGRGAVYEVRYQFDNRGKFEEYMDSTATQLRQESIQRFPPSEGVHYKRRSGEIIG